MDSMGGFFAQLQDMAPVEVLPGMQAPIVTDSEAQQLEEQFIDLKINQFLWHHCNPITYDGTMHAREPLSGSPETADYLEACSKDLISEFQADIEARLCFDAETSNCKPWNLGDDFTPLRIKLAGRGKKFITSIEKRVKGVWKREKSLYEYKYCLLCLNGQLCVSTKLFLPCGCKNSMVMDGQCLIHKRDTALNLIRGPGITHLNPNAKDGTFGSIGDYLKWAVHIQKMAISPVHANALASADADRFRLIQGPPGTGKTYYIVNRLRRLYGHLSAEAKGLLLPDGEAGAVSAEASHDLEYQRSLEFDHDDEDEEEGDKDAETDFQEGDAALVAAVTNQAVSVCLAMFLRELGFNPPEGIEDDDEDDDDDDEEAGKAAAGVNHSVAATGGDARLAGLGDFSLSDSADAAADAEAVRAELEKQEEFERVDGLPSVDPVTSNILVIGSQLNSNMRAICRPFTLHAQAQRDPDFVAVQDEVLEYQEAGKLIPEDLLNEYGMVWMEALKRVLDRTEVVFSTLTELAKLHVPTMQDLTGRVRTILLDEAGLIPEWRAVILGGLLSIDTIECIGDQMQLQPFSKLHSWRNHAVKAPEGFFTRMTRLLEFESLNTQYRMHPDICNVVSHMSYRGRLRTHDSVLTRCQTMPPYIKAIQGIHWVHHDELEARPKGLEIGWTNPHEVELVQALTAKLVNSYQMLENGHKMCIITFYKGQHKLLDEMLTENFGQYYRPDDPKAMLRLGTVDSMQGDESDVIILSMVRSNDRMEYGFLGNRNRMNVAISRAKEALVVVGNMDMFLRHPLMEATYKADVPVNYNTVEDLTLRMVEFRGDSPHATVGGDPDDFEDDFM
eukprot:m.65400 g.65400  ORF g.65400 m.65400 type:complete len:843 (-) comp12055_c0_seq1:223-2751(-)